MDVEAKPLLRSHTRIYDQARNDQMSGGGWRLVIGILAFVPFPHYLLF